MTTRPPILERANVLTDSGEARTLMSLRKRLVAEGYPNALIAMAVFHPETANALAKRMVGSGATRGRRSN
jgi:hypothetical protein